MQTDIATLCTVPPMNKQAFSRDLLIVFNVCIQIANKLGNLKKKKKQRIITFTRRYLAMVSADKSSSFVVMVSP
jgi:hypothetical protein